MEEKRFSVRRAHETQQCLSKHIIFEDKLPKRIRFVGGVDVAYVNSRSVGAAVTLSFDELELVDSQVAICKTCFPYVPTLLAFREVMPSVMSIRKLTTQPDVFLVDGHGVAHPYRCGFASHLGLVLNRPTIGVAKSNLVGEIDERRSGFNTAYVLDKGEIVGAAVTTVPGAEPVFVSVGNMVSLETAIEIVKRCTRKKRIPEPILKSHEIVTAEKRKINISTMARPNTE